MKTEATDPQKIVHIATSPKGPKDVFEQMTEWSNRIAKRAFEIFENNGFLSGRDLENWLAAERELLKPVAVEVKEKKDEFLVTAEVPGFEPKDLEIQIEGPRLVIKGKQDFTREEKNKEGAVVYTERKAKQLYRVIDLPGAVLDEKVEAEIKNGVLELKLPKAQKSTPIKITAA
ncbi:MAG: Hsp20 family protein [Acidobacteriia bacterium]|nr:Hsp20 family protein [Terriglobia bacterium]